MDLQGDLVGQDILFQIMELREEVDDALTDETLRELYEQNKLRIRDTCEELGLAFKRNDFTSAQRLTAILQYWNKIETSIVDKMNYME